ncbi:MAG: chemotaxis protein CheW [Spirochaetales bacterium]|nr:chemotaxis protein CheW [Spirochaetales bacterium]
MPESLKKTHDDPLLQRIKESRKNPEQGEGVRIEKFIKYMIISIDDKKYALFADEVKEIIGNTPIFYVPFTPPYLRGFINRHGEPYTVLDITAMLENKKLESSTFLVLKKENDQLALLISDVLEIVNLGESKLHKITSTIKDDDFFLGSISPHDEEIFVLNLASVITRMEEDIDAY